MTLPLLTLGLLTNSLLSMLVGIFGSRRNIGFGWTFLISLIFSPLVGLVVALLSDPLPCDDRNWGCVGTLLGAIGSLLLISLLILLLSIFLV